MVDPEISPEQTCMLGKFPMCSGAFVWKKKVPKIIMARLLAHIS